jgi:N-acetylneuraminate lyase
VIAGMKKFSGVTIALHACYDADGNISPDAFKTICRHYASLGVNGLYVCGSNGEGLLMNVEERKQVLEAVMEAIRGEMVVVVHIGALSTRDSIELAKHAQKMQVDAISSLPCLYYPATDATVESHWNAILDAVDLPFIIYNIPGTSHYTLSPELCQRMAARKNVIGVKNSSSSSYDINRFKRIGGEDFVVYNGPDQQYLAGRLSGATGGIGGSYGVIPELFLKIESYIQQNEIGKAQMVQNAINEIIEKMYATGSFVGASKEIISRKITYIGLPRMPIARMSPDKIWLIDELMLEIDQAITSL